MQNKILSHRHDSFKYRVLAYATVVILTLIFTIGRDLIRTRSIRQKLSVLTKEIQKQKQLSKEKTEIELFAKKSCLIENDRKALITTKYNSLEDCINKIREVVAESKMRSNFSKPRYIKDKEEGRQFSINIELNGDFLSFITIIKKLRNISSIIKIANIETGVAKGEQFCSLTALVIIFKGEGK